MLVTANAANPPASRCRAYPSRPALVREISTTARAAPVVSGSMVTRNSADGVAGAMMKYQASVKRLALTVATSRVSLAQASPLFGRGASSSTAISAPAAAIIENTMPGESVGSMSARAKTAKVR
ncbi:hypothetical protein ACWKSP_11120 [Micromonosporaceae bacterium Da 78-11]